jgi:hydrogenase-4 component B
LALLLLVAALCLVRWLLRRRRQYATTVTWDCGYVAPSVRMQYTASSFARTLTEFYSFLLSHDEKKSEVRGYFPAPTSLKTVTSDIFGELFYRPIYRNVRNYLHKILPMQHGQLHIYVIYIIMALAILLAFSVEKT